jgi:trehalose 6-phosphate phosphatase
VLFDYDGTLTPIERHPSLARLVPRTREQLRQLAALPGVRVGVISGRSLSEVRNLVGIDGIYYVGSGGLEIDLIDREQRYPDTDAIGTLLDAIQDQMLDQLKKFPGTWLERKPGAIAIHYRGLLPLAATCFRFEMINLVSAAAALKFQVVSEAIEVTPAEGWDKGTAVLSILDHVEATLQSHPLAVYFGDEANDVEGMAMTTQTGGMTVGIGPYAPWIADQRLADSSELVACLDELLARLATQRGLPSPCPDAGNEPDLAPTPETDAGLLLLDPDAEARNELAAGLTALGWQVWQADTSEQATELVSVHGDSIQVALVDLQLPGLLGARTQSELGQRHPGLIRCFLSADISPYTAAAFGRLSSLPLFVKPLTAGELNTTLRAMLRQAPHAMGSH